MYHRIDAKGICAKAAEMILPQWKHQESEWAHKYDTARAWLWQMRTGKTKQAVDNACALHEAGEIDRVLVIAPNRIHENWIEVELPKHLWTTVKAEGYRWKNSDPLNEDKFRRFMIQKNALLWFAVNMESLIIERAQKAIRQFLNKGHSLLIVDEVHHFAKPSARRTGVARGIARLCDYRRILSGTSVEDSPLMAFSEYEILEKGALGHTTYSGFKDEFAVQNTMRVGSRQFLAVTGYKNQAELRRRMSRYTSVVMREDCEDLPEVQNDVHWTPMSDILAGLWKKCKKLDGEFMARFSPDMPLEGGAHLTKLQQIEGGYWKHADGHAEELVPLEENYKMLALLDELKQYNNNVIVWFQYLHEIEAAGRYIKQELDEDASVVSGQNKDSAAHIKMFKTGARRILLGQPAAAGEGLELPAGMILRYSQTPRAVTLKQSRERATIMGAKSVQEVDLMVPNGVCVFFKGLTDNKVSLAEFLSRGGMKQVLEQLKGE